MSMNISPRVRFPVRIFKRYTRKTFFLHNPENPHRRMCSRVPKCVLLPPALWAQFLDLEWEYMMCSTKYGYWRPLIDPPSHPTLMSYGGILLQPLLLALSLVVAVSLSFYPTCHNHNLIVVFWGAASNAPSLVVVRAVHRRAPPLPPRLPLPPLPSSPSLLTSPLSIASYQVIILG